MESIDILAGIDREGDGMLVDVLWGRGLHEDAVDGGIGIQLPDQLHHLFLSGEGGKFKLSGVHTERRAGTVLIADIGLGGGILSDKYYGQSRCDTASVECLDTRQGLEFDFGGYRLAINEFHEISEVGRRERSELSRNQESRNKREGKFQQGRSGEFICNTS